MKILQITHNYPSESDNTEGVFLHRINQQLASEIEIIVIHLRAKFGSPRVVDSYRIDNVLVYEINYFRPKGRIFNSLDGLFMLSARNKLPIDLNEIDIIHSHWQTDGGLLGTYLARKFIKPHIVSVRGARIFNKSKGTIYGQISNYVFKNANIIHTHGESIFHELHNKYCIPESKLILIHNILFNSKQLQSLLEANLKKTTRKEDFQFLFIGLDGKQKGLLDAVKSFLSISPQGKHMLTIVTDITSHYFKQKIAPLVINKKNIVVLGKTNPEDIYHLFSKADVFLFPSLGEGSPNVVLEAMAAGCYIISYDIPGLNQLITHNVNGRVVPIHSVKSLSEDINMLVLNNKQSEFQRYKDYNYSFIKERFSGVSIKDRYINMYKSLLKRGA